MLPTEALNIETPNWRTEDVAMLEDMANRFFEQEVVPHYERFEKQEMVDREVWEKAGTNGLLCASMPEEYGGGGGTYAHEAVIAEALGHQGADGFGLALHNAIVAPYILHYGSEDQKKKWLPRMATGELIGAIAMTEPGTGSDLQGIKTSAVKDGNHYKINGSKTFITNGQHANLIIVVAKTDPSLGAKGTFIGRSYIYGLGAIGQAGVTKSLEIIQKELDISMGLCGCRSIDELSRKSLLMPSDFSTRWA